MSRPGHDTRRFATSRTIGGGRSRAADIGKLRRALEALDYLHSPVRAAGRYTPTVAEAVTAFQKDAALVPDGRIEPGGPTERAIDVTLAAKDVGGEAGAGAAAANSRSPLATGSGTLAPAAQPVPPRPKRRRPPAPPRGWVVPGAKAGTPGNPDRDPYPKSRVPADFRYELHARESKADNYQAKNKSGALGRYQMTPGALQDAGMMTDARAGKWAGVVIGGKKIDSAQAFLDSPLAQEIALETYMERTERSVRNRNLLQYIRRNIDGIKRTITVTKASLMAAAHRRGAGMVRRYFDHLNANNWKTNGARISAEFLEVETRLREFQHINYP